MRNGSPVLAPTAAVATAHPLATTAALRILDRGGTAADAAVAVSAVLCVVEPWASHVGGDAFGLVWDAGRSRARAIQGSGRAPKGIDSAKYAARDCVDLRGGGSVAVPGMVGAWSHLHATRGRLPFEEVLAPAIALASDGFPVNRRWQRIGRLQSAVIESDRHLLDLFGSKTKPVRFGDQVRQPELAETLRNLGRDGAAYLYDGPLGAEMAREVQLRGGSLTVEDLHEHETEEADPLSAEVSGFELIEQPPVSQGVMVVAAMRALEATDQLGWQLDGNSPLASARETHLQVEVYRRVRAYRDRFFCDPGFATSKLLRRFDHWVSAEHARGTAERIDPSRTVPIGTSPSTREVRDTTYFCVADGEGDVVGWIQSIFHPFGAGFVIPGTGILLNNRICGFSFDLESPNRIEAGKRTVHTLNSWMVLRDGHPWLVGGTPGAEHQIQTNIQILRSRLVRSIDLAAAIDAPRWMLDEKDRLALEGRHVSKVRQQLARIGHETIRIGPWDGSGFVQALERLEGGGWLACVDPRGEGLSAGY